MTHLLLVAATTGYQIRSFGEAAARTGVRVTLASDRCDHLDDPWRDGAIPVRFDDSSASVRAVRTALAGAPLHGVLAVGDRPAMLAAAIAAALGLPGHPPAAAAACRNKVATRRAFQDAGLRTPSFQVVPVTADPREVSATLTYPVVVKPLALSGSRGVIRADSPAAFVAGFHRLLRILRAADIRLERDVVHDHVLVESFVPGREFAVEGVLSEGRLQLLAIFDKPDPLDGPFFEETIYVTPSRARADEQAAIAGAAASAAQALGLVHGPVHAECRLNATGVHVLEVAARPIGGLCARALSFQAPDRSLASLEEVLLRHAIGEDVRGYTREERASGVMMLPIPSRGVYRGVDGIDNAQAVPGVEAVVMTAKVDTLLEPLPEGRSYLGFVFAGGSTPDRVERSLRDAHRALRFRIDRALDLAD